MSGLQTSVVATLTSWTAPSSAQESLRQDYLAHLAAHPDDGVWRRGRPAHVTASAVIVDPAGERTLLVLHGRINLWVQPGGHCEEGDTSLAAAAAREAREETGLLDLVVRPEPLLLSRHGAPCGAQTHLDVQYLATAPADAVPLVSAESHAVRWFPVTELPEGLASGVAESVAAARLAALARS